MNVFIAGGAGFIGFNLVKFWLEKYPGDQIVVLDNLSRPASSQLAELNGRKQFHFQQGNIRNSRLVKKIYSEYQPQIVLNCTFPYRTNDLIPTLIQGNQTLLENLGAGKSTLARYIFISTDAVYGQSLVSPTHKPYHTEVDPIYPTRVVTALQASAELLINAYHVQAQIPTAIIRVGNVFGPYQHPDQLLPSLILRALQNQDLHLPGDGTAIQSWLYIDDLVRLIDKIALAPVQDVSGQIFNAAGEIEISLLETVEMLLTILNKPKELMTLDSNEPTPESASLLDIDRVRKLGWRPETEFKQALEATIAWYRQRA